MTRAGSCRAFGRLAEPSCVTPAKAGAKVRAASTGRAAWAACACLRIAAFIFAASPARAEPPFAGAPRVDDHFVNLYPFELPTPIDLADWYWHWTLDGGTKPPAGGYAAIPVLKPDLDYLRANRSDTTVTWVGHSTLLLQLAGLNVLTDPQFSRRASPFSFVGPARKVRVPFTIAEGPRVDVVVISHNHYDHLDVDSVQALARQPGGSPLFVVPLGVDRWMHDHGIDRVEALDWWRSRELPAGDGDRLRITMVPVQHWSARSPADRFETLWGGYVIERVAGATEDVQYRFFFGGDTGYAPLFRELIHARFARFDFAALPIGAYEPNRYLKAQHANPEEAVRMHRDLDVAQSMGIHWGTFVLTTEPFDQPPKDLAIAVERAGLKPDAFVTFRHGEMRVLERKGVPVPAPPLIQINGIQ